MQPFEDHKHALASMRQSIPGLGETGPLFWVPWQTRVFALVVAMVEQGFFPWAVFQTRFAALITEMEKHEAAHTARSVESRYFECWLQAVEETLADQGMLGAADIDDKMDSLRHSIAEIRAAQTHHADG